MSGYTEQAEAKRQHLLRFALRIIDGLDPAETVLAEKELIDQITPAKVITLVDDLVRQEIPMERLKPGISKLLNLFHKSLSSLTQTFPQDNILLGSLLANNRQAEVQLSSLRPLIRQLRKEPNDPALRSNIRAGLRNLLKYTSHYTVMENAIFPPLEKYWTDYRCLSVMWSLHDDIRHALKELVTIMSQAEIELQHAFSLVGTLFFNIAAIIFREEKILFPHMLATLNESDWNNMLWQSRDLDWPFEAPALNDHDTSLSDKVAPIPEEWLDLGSGRLSVDQIRLLFNHLPVDITFVDEHNRVRYFSEGKKRTFPRSRAIIGRLVQNCHPLESVAVVEEIISAFRKGEKNQAEFWIDMPQGKVLIQYFAVRDQEGLYRGVIEVSQEIESIQKLQGERRLLDWSL